MAALALDGLAAYSVGGIPLPWVGNALAIFGALWVAVSSRRLVTAGLAATWGVFVLVFWMMLSITANSEAFGSTGGYMLVGLRVLNVIAFAAAVFLVIAAIRIGGPERTSERVVSLGTVVAVVALYIYFAQVLHLPEPPRTRLGTGGEVQATSFSYAFHRAMGTFREPSHLAEWLIVPAFLALAQRGRRRVLRGAPMVVALLLTGSLTGFLGLAVGLIVLLGVASIRRDQRSVRAIFTGLAITVLAVGVFGLAVASNQSSQVSLVNVLSERIEPILEEGPEASNRGYVYDYLRRGARISILGEGPGVANVRLSQFRGIRAVSSFLSLYINAVVALGVGGLLLLMLVLFWPFGRALLGVGRYHGSRSLLHSSALAGYGAWLAMYAVHAEELALIFAVPFGLAAGMRAARAQDDLGLAPIR